MEFKIDIQLLEKRPSEQHKAPVFRVLSAALKPEIQWVEKDWWHEHWHAKYQYQCSVLPQTIRPKKGRQGITGISISPPPLGGDTDTSAYQRPRFMGIPRKKKGVDDRKSTGMPCATTSCFLAAMHAPKSGGKP